MKNILKTYRAEHDLTQSQLAEKLECSQDLVSKIERGERFGPDHHPVLQRWGRVLGETPESLRPDIYNGTAA